MSDDRPAHETSPPGRTTPESVQARIDEMRRGQQRGDADTPALGHAVALFMTMGFSFAGSLVAGILIGAQLVKYTGHQYWYIVMLLVGLGGGVSVVWRLLKPLLK